MTNDGFRPRGTTLALFLAFLPWQGGTLDLSGAGQWLVPLFLAAD